MRNTTTFQQFLTVRMAVLFLLASGWLNRVAAQVTTEVAWQRCIGGGDQDNDSELTPTSDGGLLCLGWGPSTDGDFQGTHGAEDMVLTKLNADGMVTWSRVLGGSYFEQSVTCVEASDGSIMVVGTSASADGDVDSGHGNTDLWIIKLSPTGIIIWEHTYGGTEPEYSSEWIDIGHHLIETPDGGFFVHGCTASPDGDVTGYHPGNQTYDVWVLKISATGALEWNRALGGSGNDNTSRAIATTDGGFAICMHTESNDGDVTDYKGGGDYWLGKLSATGTLLWSRTVGGSGDDLVQDLRELPNGDLVLFGSTASTDGDIAQNHGGTDMMVARLSSNGALQWARTYGGTSSDACTSLIPLANGGFLLGGHTRSNDGDVQGNHGDLDAWLVEVNGTGDMVWQRTFGGTQSDVAFIQEAQGNGYYLTGQTTSTDGDVQGNHGNFGNLDLWLVKINVTGDLLWQRCLGGSGTDYGYLKAQTSDSCLVLFGNTWSNDGDVSGNHGQRDIWVVKLKVIEPPVPPECTLYIPTAFSPDNSTKNDTHCLYGTDCITSMSFNIFDRWGNKVFESTDRNACWDGIYNGQPLDPAVFVYHLSATLNNGESVERQGNITLMR
jgi:gliding motility-associated-like protein